MQLAARLKLGPGTPWRILLLWAVVACGSELLGCQDEPAPVRRQPPAAKSAGDFAARGASPPLPSPGSARAPAEAAPPAKLAAGVSRVAGHLLAVPPGLEPGAGSYDLAVHFHGSPEVVQESYAASEIGAAVLVINLGEGSQSYRAALPDRAAVDELLAAVEAELHRRGLSGAHRRRLALSAWSAGYGGVLQLLALAPELVDAAILLDGPHAGYYQGSYQLNLRALAPLLQFARRALRGEVLLLITHSQVPIPSVATVQDTADALLAELRVSRTMALGSPPPPELKSVADLVPAHRRVTLSALTEAQEKGLIVRGFAGRTKEHHLAHLFSMAAIALPDLAARWRRAAPESAL